MGSQIALLASLALFAVLLGTLGGVGSLIGHLVTPQVRAYNRISIYIAFLMFYFFIVFCLFHFATTAATLRRMQRDLTTLAQELALRTSESQRGG